MIAECIQKCKETTDQEKIAHYLSEALGLLQIDRAIRFDTQRHNCLRRDLSDWIRAALQLAALALPLGIIQSAVSAEDNHPAQTVQFPSVRGKAVELIGHLGIIKTDFHIAAFL